MHVARALILSPVGVVKANGCGGPIHTLSRSDHNGASHCASGSVHRDQVLVSAPEIGDEVLIRKDFSLPYFRQPEFSIRISAKAVLAAACTGRAHRLSFDHGSQRPDSAHWRDA